MASVAVGIRLEREVWERHAAAAQTLGVPVSVYLRQRLEEKDQTGFALAELQSTVERAVSTAAPRSEAGPPIGLLVEMLLVLRQLAGPQRSAIAQKEVERLGLPTWR